MHPDLDEEAFVRWYTSHRLVEVVKQLSGCREEDLQMGEEISPRVIKIGLS